MATMTPTQVPKRKISEPKMNCQTAAARYSGKGAGYAQAGGSTIGGE